MTGRLGPVPRLARRGIQSLRSSWPPLRPLD
jgi:hypothetical protein